MKIKYRCKECKECAEIRVNGVRYCFDHGIEVSMELMRKKIPNKVTNDLEGKEEWDSSKE